MSSVFNRSVIACIAVVALLISGCATSAKVKSNLEFREREDKIPLTLRLYVSPEAKNYVASKQYTANYKLCLGESLEANARRALEKIFDKVVIADQAPSLAGAGSANDYTISIEFGDRTKIKMGSFTFSSNDAQVDLHCVIYDRNGNNVWSKNILAKLSKASAAGILSLAGPIGSIAGNAGYIDALRAAGEGATQQALEQLNDSLLAERNMFTGK